MTISNNTFQVYTLASCYDHYYLDLGLSLVLGYTFKTGQCHVVGTSQDGLLGKDNRKTRYTALRLAKDGVLNETSPIRQTRL